VRALLSAWAAALPLLAASDEAFLAPEMRCGREPCAWFALALEAGGGATVLPRGLAPERLLPNGECYVQAGERLAVPAGALRASARAGRWRAAPERIVLAPGEEKKPVFACTPPALPATPREIIYFRAELPPIFVARAEQCEFERIPADARAFDPAHPAFDADATWAVAPGVRIAAFAPAYFAALAEGRTPIVLVENAARVTAGGWDSLPGARRTIVAGNARSLPPVVAGGAGVSEGPTVVLAADRAPVAGQTVRIDAAKTVRVRAMAWDPQGIARLEIRLGTRAALLCEAETPEPVMHIEGDLVLSTPTFVIAYARTTRGEEALSGVMRVELKNGRARGAYAPLRDWTSPQRAFGVPLRVTAREDLADTLYACAKTGVRVAPPETPLALRAGDAVTLDFTLALPDVRELPAHVPVTLLTAAGTVWEGTILVAPWDLDVFRPEGAPTLVRQEGRIGLKFGALPLRALAPVAAPRALVLEVFGEGWSDASIALTIRGAPPRQPLVLAKPLPARRGWHTIEYETAGYRIAPGTALQLEARAAGTALLGAVRALE
jgi:hypothetical protein